MIVRGHAALLFVITTIAVIFSSAGWQGSGPYRLLADQPWGYVGLYQAYLLMFLLALECWIGAGRWGGRLWNAILLFAEMIPTSIILIGWNILHQPETENFAAAGFAIHLPLITLETVSALLAD